MQRIVRMVGVAAIAVLAGCSVPPSSAHDEGGGAAHLADGHLHEPANWLPAELLQALKDGNPELTDALSKGEGPPFSSAADLGSVDVFTVFIGVREDDTCFGLFNAAEGTYHVSCIQSQAGPHPLWLAVNMAGAAAEESAVGAVLTPQPIDVGRSSQDLRLISPSVAVVSDARQSSVDVVDAAGTVLTIALQENS